jgi:hypothetical protein
MMAAHLEASMAPLRAALPLALLLALSGCSLDGTASVPGQVNHFDPVVALPDVQLFAGSTKLVRLTARFVREDGTQDLEADYVGYNLPTEYEFIRPNQQQASSAPLGARPQVAPYESVVVSVQKPHWVNVTSANQNGSFKHQGMASTVNPSTEAKAALPAPCPFVRLWSAARQHGAPAGAVAAITFDASGYLFQIDGTPYQLKFDPACAPLAR